LLLTPDARRRAVPVNDPVVQHAEFIIFDDMKNLERSFITLVESRVAKRDSCPLVVFFKKCFE
jgi:hypothetical protein